MPAVADAVLVNLQEAKYDERPLPVQQFAGPIIAAGCSLLATAETGSGKTAAYLVPIISRLHQQRQSWPSARSRSDVKHPAALVIAPTHELVTQIAKAAEALAKGTCVRVSVAHGNLDSKQQRQQLNRGCDLLVASRGRALQLMQEGRIGLENAETLCFDEADVLLQGEGAQQIECMRAMCPAGVQMLMFSATFHPDHREQARAQLLPEDFGIIPPLLPHASSLAVTPVVLAVELHVGRVGMISENVEQNFFLADTDDDKLRFLEHVLRRKQHSPSKGGTVIFVNTRARADLLCKHLVSMSIAATCMHGELVADERRENLMLFSKGHCEVLVATAAFGRGLDLPFITHVINYDLPHTRDG
jgi:superfamily II DNA/RNA helicase